MKERILNNGFISLRRKLSKEEIDIVNRSFDPHETRIDPIADWYWLGKEIEFINEEGNLFERIESILINLNQIERGLVLGVVIDFDGDKEGGIRLIDGDLVELTRKELLDFKKAS